MKTRLNLLFVIPLFFSCLKPVLAQDDLKAPSLQVGLSGLSFSRGGLDAALIAEIIAEKQKEVKVKLIKNMLLNKLGVDNGLFYAFIDQNIEILLNEKDEDTRVKNLLENVVNLAFVVGYAEYYVETLKPNTASWQDFKNLGLAFGVDAALFSKTKLSLTDFAKVEHNGTSADGRKLIRDTPQQDIRNRFTGVVVDLFSEVVRQNASLKALGVLRTNYLQNYISMNAYIALKDEKNDLDINPLINALQNQLSINGYQQQIDVMNKIQLALQSRQVAMLTEPEKDLAKNYAELVKTSIASLNSGIESLKEPNKVFGNAYNENYTRATQKSGDFNAFILKNYNIDIPTMSQPMKEQWSLLFRYLDAKFKSNFFDILLQKKAIADQVFTNVTLNLNIHVKYYGLIKSMVAKGNNFDANVTTLSTQFPCGNLNQYTTDMASNFSRGRATITDLSKLTAEDTKALEKAGSFMDKLKYVTLNRYEYMRQYEEEVRPALVSLGKYSTDFLAAGKNMEGVLNCIEQTVIDDLKLINIDLNPAFINIFTKIDAFDKADTYAHFINYLSDAGDLFSDDEMRKSINKVITFLKSYIKVVDKPDGSLGLSLDVEGFLMSMQRMPYNRFSPFGLHFTVGTNTASFNGDLMLSDGSTIRNYSFVGEKIGVKFKIVDYKYLNSFSKGETFSYWGSSYIRTAPPKEPAISNIHLLIYGSGLLYNLTNTGTTSNFNSPLIGIGAGITFFNDLDFNISWGTPVVKNKPFLDKSLPTFFNVGFDVQFFEYYNRLQQKRKANQTQKKLAAAKSN